MFPSNILSLTLPNASQNTDPGQPVIPYFEPMVTLSIIDMLQPEIQILLLLEILNNYHYSTGVLNIVYIQHHYITTINQWQTMLYTVQCNSECQDLVQKSPELNTLVLHCQEASCVTMKDIHKTKLTCYQERPRTTESMQLGLIYLHSSSWHSLTPCQQSRCPFQTCSQSENDKTKHTSDTKKQARWLNHRIIICIFYSTEFSQLADVGHGG